MQFDENFAEYNIFDLLVFKASSPHGENPRKSAPLLTDVQALSSLSSAMP
jgi:hypothetical protein